MYLCMYIYLLISYRLVVSTSKAFVTYSIIVSVKLILSPDMNLVLKLQVLGADLAILDEIDSGLDVDALRDVAKAVNGLFTPTNSVLIITHYLRLLEYIKPTYIHIMVSL